MGYEGVIIHPCSNIIGVLVNICYWIGNLPHYVSFMNGMD